MIALQIFCRKQKFHFEQFLICWSMKKLCVVILILLLACACVPAVVFAQSETEHSATYVPEHKGYRLTTLVDGDKIVGAKFSGYYFGASGIQVVVEIYSSLDFYLGDDDSLLTSEQQDAKQKLVALAEEIHRLITKVDECANTTYNGDGLPCSDIWRYNQAKCGDKLQISAETYEMLKLAREMYNDTDGAFNPAVYRLVDLWGFSSRIYSQGAFDVATYPYDRPVSVEEFLTTGYPLPKEKYVEAFSQKQFTDFSDTAVTLTQDGDNYFVTKNVAPVTVDGVEFQQWLDLGGIAKGFVVDEITQLLKDNGFGRYYVDAGSSSSAHGLDAYGNNPILTLADPFVSNSFSTQALLSFEIEQSTVSTSGQYVRRYVTKGVEYSHIIDGTTGAPAQTGVKMVSVVVPQKNGLWAGKGDCLTTALTVMGRDKIVEFVNGYLKEHEITVVVLLETFDGKQEICTNLSKNNVKNKGQYFDNYAWTLSQQDGNYFYDAEATFDRDSFSTKTIAWVLAAVCGTGLLALLIFHVVKGKKGALQNVAFARNDKPFKAADVGAYLLVALLIVVLFGVFFSEESTAFQTVAVTDTETGEQLFFYNMLRNEYKVQQGENCWQIQVEQTNSGITVTFSREIDGETRLNVVEIIGGRAPTVKMADSVCGFSQDCVRNFNEISQSGGVIVCSPNRLKVTTE